MNTLTDTLLQSSAGSGWKKIGVRHHHGILIILSALHSQHSCGIGEFLDLLPMIDWCQHLGIDTIQLLPLNNREGNPSPYDAFSSLALNPLYLSLYALPHLEKHPELIDALKTLTQLTNTERIVYREVFTHKMHWLHTYVDVTGNKILESQAFKQYVHDHPWVESYSLYRTLKDQFRDSPIESWPSELRSIHPQERSSLIKHHQNPINFYILLQYLCFLQLKSVKEYANKRGLFLMGDLPILLSKDSVDVWEHPELFITHLQAGAPPDVYNQEGQNWGFPIFNWDAERSNQFSWWKQRLGYAGHFYDLFRLDHVLGFFRIWAIPPGHLSKEGYFVPPDQEQWESQGREILSMICASTEMLPIAEDLGTVHKMVRPCLTQMGICGTKVMRWERKWETDKHYLLNQEYPPISLTCVSTHDSEPLSLWWKLFPDEAQILAQDKHWIYTPELTLRQREEILWDSHHTASLFHINPLQEYLALFPELVHYTPEEERINIPGKILPTNWTYRYLPPVEEIISHESLFQKMKKIVFSSSF